MSSNIDVISSIFSVHQGYNITGAIPIGIIGIFLLNLAYTFAYIDPLDNRKKTKSPNFSNIVLILYVYFKNILVIIEKYSNLVNNYYKQKYIKYKLKYLSI